MMELVNIVPQRKMGHLPIKLRDFIYLEGKGHQQIVGF